MDGNKPIYKDTLLKIFKVQDKIDINKDNNLSISEIKKQINDNKISPEVEKYYRKIISGAIDNIYDLSFEQCLKEIFPNFYYDDILQVLEWTKQWSINKMKLNDRHATNPELDEIFKIYCRFDDDCSGLL